MCSHLNDFFSKNMYTTSPISCSTSLLDSAILVCFLGDICLKEVRDDSLGRALITLIERPNVFKWQRAYLRICGAHAIDLITLDITSLAPTDEIEDLHKALCDRENGAADWRNQFLGLMDRATHAGVRALAAEAVYLPYPLH